MKLTEVTLTWPVAQNVKLSKIYLDGKLIAAPGTTTSGIPVVLTGEPAKKIVEAGNSELLTFEFTDGANPGEYIVTVKFDTPCTKSASKTW